MLRITALARSWRVPSAAELERMSFDEANRLYQASRRARARAAVLAEMERRDREDEKRARIEAGRARARATMEARRDEYALYVYDAWMAAETDCNGYLLSKAGLAARVEPADLWSMQEKRAVRYASQELREWWQLNGRWTYRQFQQQSREQRPEAVAA